MPDTSTSYRAVTVTNLNMPTPFGGEFAVLCAEKLNTVLAAEKSFKSKFYLLITVKSGTGTLSLDNTAYEIKGGRVFYINYNQIFSFSADTDFEGKLLFFTRSFYNMIYTGNTKIKNDTAFSGLPTYLDFKKNDFTGFMLGIADIHNETSKNALRSKEIVCLLLKVAMLKYIQKSGNAQHADFRTDRKVSYVEDFASLVDANFKELKRTSDYAAKLSITPNYLNAVVKERLDISAERYIQNRVILEAERLLLNTHLSVTEISYELGFSDKSHFGKYFRKIAGETPNRFRKKAGAAEIE
ncbi:transcriptional regulator, AraC family [Flavobacteriaceae bacterium 3519-10]|nr:transcriptional regulator, AraC family [Flavobacteriaceae bacterium 3519-10]